MPTRCSCCVAAVRKGYPGMPEVANLPLPAKLLQQGVRDMVRICDGRMSGTAYGTVVLHVAPEAAAGGPLGLVRTGDFVILDVAARRLDIDIPAEELAARQSRCGDGQRLCEAASRLGAALRCNGPAGQHRSRPGLSARGIRRQSLSRIPLTEEQTTMSTPIADGRPIRWGILGAGGIADDRQRRHQPDRRQRRHRRRCTRRRPSCRARRPRGAARSYGDYAALVNDDEVDVVYVSTTHPHHRAHSLLAIEAGKAVLIEKPVCLNAADAREVFAAATRAGVFAMEAMWMRTNPLIRMAQQMIADGAIGEVRGVRSEFGLGLAFDPKHRLYELANGGGALLDLGVYPATFAYLFLGPPDKVITVGTLASTGSDETVAMQWMYGSHPGAQIWTSVPIHAPNEAAILGTKGWITLLPQMYRPGGLVLHNDAGERHVDDPLAGNGSGYQPEIEEVERCLRAGLHREPAHPARRHASRFSRSLTTHEQLSVCVYPGEKGRS